MPTKRKNKMEDITAIILTKNEEKNIKDCINSIKCFVKRIVVVDSYSTDETVAIAKGLGAEVYQHYFENYAKQFMYAEKIANITTKWTFRLDADERISEEAAKEIIKICKEDNPQITGIIVRFTVEFLGKKLYHGGIYPFRKLLIFRTGKGEIEDRAMDEHIVLYEGSAVELKNDSYHHDYKDLTHWIDKHNKYSDREVKDYLDSLKITGYANKESRNLDYTARFKRWVKFYLYYRLPIGTRAHLYFLYRYYFKLGFLDGKEGKIFCFMQAYWYRFLVDSKIYEYSKRNII